jgi:hypothetical protein
MSDPSTERYRAEFASLGAERVRNQLMLRRWPKHKLAAARDWLERADVARWVATRKDDRPVRRSSGRRTWVVYAITGFAMLFAAVRLLRMMGHL